MMVSNFRLCLKLVFFFLRKLKILYISDYTIWFKYRHYMVQVRIKLCMERLKTSSANICKGNMENLYFDQTFYVIITDADIGSLRSFHIIRKVFECWWNLKKIVWSEMYKILSILGLRKCWRHFGRRFCDLTIVRW